MKQVKIEVKKRKETLCKTISMPTNLIEAVEIYGEEKLFNLLEQAILQEERKKLSSKRVFGKKYLKIDLTKLHEEQLSQLINLQLLRKPS